MYTFKVVQIVSKQGGNVIDYLERCACILPSRLWETAVMPIGFIGMQHEWRRKILITQSPTINTLPMNALQEIPTPEPDAQRIVALVKSGGRVTGYQLSDGRILSKEAGVALARQGGIQGVGISSRKGSEYLKSIPDGTENNNLNSLPTVKQPMQ